MHKIVKVYGKGGNPDYFFIDGVRSDATTDFDVLQAIFGSDLEEYWLADDMYLEDAHDMEVMSKLESAETLEEFEDLIERYPEMVEDI